MRVAMETLAYTVPPEDRGYYELSTAIIELAVDDYRKYRQKNAEEKLVEVRVFFLSDMFENLSGVDNPNLFLYKLDEQIEKELKSGVKRKRKKQIMKCNG